MRRTGLDFAPGTTDDCKRLIGSLFKPDEILGAYRHARATLHTGDIVLVVSEQDPSGFKGWVRTLYANHLREALGGRKLPFIHQSIAANSAHSIMKLPFESDAMWVVVTRGQDLPVYVVLYATQFDIQTEAEASASPN